MEKAPLKRIIFLGFLARILADAGGIIMSAVTKNIPVILIAKAIKIDKRVIKINSVKLLFILFNLEISGLNRNNKKLFRKKIVNKIADINNDIIIKR